MKVNVVAERSIITTKDKTYKHNIICVKKSLF